MVGPFSLPDLASKHGAARACQTLGHRFRRSMPLSMPTRHFFPRFSPLFVFLGASLILFAPATIAQTAAPSVPTAPIPKPAVAAAPALNILILALDDLTPTAVEPTPADLLNPAPETLAVPPIAAPPVAITPAGFATQNRVFRQILAQVRAPKDMDFDDPRLRPLPDGVTPPAPTIPLPKASELERQVAPPGNAQLAAFPLHRALKNLGYADILTTAPDGTALVRELSAKRLTPRVLDSIKNGLAALENNPGDAKIVADATKQVGQQAAALGQLLGYRAVVVLHVAPFQAGKPTPFSAVLADASREVAETILWDENGADVNTLREIGATTGAALLDKSLKSWPDVTPAEKLALANGHLNSARVALLANQPQLAQDEINQAISLDSRRTESYILLGDTLSQTDPIAAAAAYRRATDLNTKDGATWAKIAAAYAYAAAPDWPNALQAGRRALAVGYDTMPLRVAMATAEFGRAQIFRKFSRTDRATDADAAARKHLDRALEIAPDDPTAVRLLARSLIKQNRMEEAATTLDRVAPRYPRDPEIQLQYAQALASQAGREEDAFSAYSRVWKLKGETRVDVDDATYASLAEGFDVRIYNLGKTSKLLASGVQGGTIARESALLQLTKLKEEADAAEVAINVMKVPLAVGAATGAARAFAATLMSQSLEKYQIYLETGQDSFRQRGTDLFNQSVAQLNSARAER